MRMRVAHLGWLILATVALVLGAIGFRFWSDYRRTQEFKADVDARGGVSDAEAAGPFLFKRWVEDHEDAWNLQWLRTEVNLVHAEGDRFDDAWSVQLERHPKIVELQIVELQLAGTKITDAGLVSLKSLTRLEHLDLSQTQITDAGLSSLAGLDNLEVLNLDNTAITDRGLVTLRSLKRLKALKLIGTKMTDAGLEKLAKIPTLTIVEIGNSDVTEAGLKRLKSLRPEIQF